MRFSHFWPSHGIFSWRRGGGGAKGYRPPQMLPPKPQRTSVTFRNGHSRRAGGEVDSLSCSGGQSVPHARHGGRETAALTTTNKHPILGKSHGGHGHDLLGGTLALYIFWCAITSSRLSGAAAGCSLARGPVRATQCLSPVSEQKILHTVFTTIRFFQRCSCLLGHAFGLVWHGTTHLPVHQQRRRKDPLRGSVASVLIANDQRQSVRKIPRLQHLLSEAKHTARLVTAIRSRLQSAHLGFSPYSVPVPGTRT